MSNFRATLNTTWNHYITPTSTKKAVVIFLFSKKMYFAFVYYNFCWVLCFQPLEENWATSGLFNILNGINIGNLWPIYAAIRAYFKNSILKSFAFYNFCWILDFQPLEDWANSGLLNIPNGINIANPVPMAYLKIKFCEISHLQLLLETWFSALRRGLVCPKLIIDQLWVYSIY